MGPAVSATLGQMLDDFFQYAAELQQSLEQQGEACMGWLDMMWAQFVTHKAFGAVPEVS